MTALLLTGGPGHPAEASADSMQQLLGPHDAYVDIEAGLRALDPQRHDLLVVNALSFQMLDARYDDGRREAHGFALGDHGRAAIGAWVSAGRPVLGIHTAVLCFDDWDEWASILGGSWVWGRSFHPEIGPLTVDAGTHRFEVVDELYSDLAIVPTVEVVATADGQPVAWRHRYGDAKVACCVLGHDARSLAAPGCQKLLTELRDWAMT